MSRKRFLSFKTVILSFILMVTEIIGQNIEQYEPYENVKINQNYDDLNYRVNNPDQQSEFFYRNVDVSQFPDLNNLAHYNIPSIISGNQNSQNSNYFMEKTGINLNKPSANDQNRLNNALLLAKGGANNNSNCTDEPNLEKSADSGQKSNTNINLTNSDLSDVKTKNIDLSGSSLSNSNDDKSAQKANNGKMNEIQRIVQQLYVAQAQVQLEATEIQRAQAVANAAQSNLEEAVNNARVISSALQAAQQTVAAAALSAQAAHLQLAAHDQLLFAAREKVDALSAQMVGLQAQEGIENPRVTVNIPSLLHRLKQPLTENEKPTPIPSILNSKSRRASKKKIHENSKVAMKTIDANDLIAKGKQLIKLNKELFSENSGYAQNENLSTGIKKEIPIFSNDNIKYLVNSIVEEGIKRGEEIGQFYGSDINNIDVDPFETVRKSQNQQYIDEFLNRIQKTDLSKFQIKVNSLIEMDTDEIMNKTSTEKPGKFEKLRKPQTKQKDPNIQDYLLKFQASLLRPYLKSKKTINVNKVKDDNKSIIQNDDSNYKGW